jgi:pimeloyl-ACP methyl ester carboxylesterase
MTATRSLTLTDGRAVEAFVGGDREGFALVMHHGTPTEATTFADWNDDCLERALRLICISRPGYGASTRLPRRSVASVAQDIAEVLNALGHTSFVTAGWSGGGPHALACAALLADRCVAAATLAGVGPFGQPDLDFLAGMGPENVDEFATATKGEAALRAWMDAHGESHRTITGDALAEALGGLVPQVDKDALTGAFADHLAATIRRAVVSYDGWIDDDLAFSKPWGFDLAQIAAPVTVWHGDLDLMVPFAHGQWLVRRLPNARARLRTGEGHISLVTRGRREILDELARAVPSRA